MSIWRLVVKELVYRKVAFCLAVLAVAMGVSSLVAAAAILNLHDRRTEEILARLERDVRQQAAELKDDMRRATLKLSFNLLILPDDQNLRDWHTDDYASKYMPESYVHQLAASGIIMVRHFLPTLQQRVAWPEQHGRTIILVGTRGEVPNLAKDPRKPLVQPVPSGTIVLGRQLHETLGLKVGDTVRLMGREFTVHRCHEERGSKDDITAWIHLSEAQELLHRPAQINAILALQCLCAGMDLAKLRREIEGVLPDTQVVEMGSKILARYEARSRISREAKEALEFERRERGNLRSQRETLASVLSPLFLTVAAAWVGLSALREARLRRNECGILRAIGASSGRVLWLFLAKGLVLGVTGGLLGYVIGLLFGLWGGRVLEGAVASCAWTDVANAVWLPVPLTISIVLSLTATWIPALAAARTDPAKVLREE